MKLLNNIGSLLGDAIKLSFKLGSRLKIAALCF